MVDRQYWHFFFGRYPAHEEIVEKIALSVGFKSVSLSSKIMPMMRIVPRGFTAASDAYLTPHIQRYLKVTYITFQIYQIANN